jgi:hypothetical protein
MRWPVRSGSECRLSILKGGLLLRTAEAQDVARDGAHPTAQTVVSEGIFDFLL